MNLKTSILITAVASAAGCVVGPEPTTPTIELSPAFSIELENSRPFSNEIAWWEHFGNAELSKVMRLVRANNLQVAIARANLERSFALSTAARSDLFPTLDAFIDNGLSIDLEDTGRTDDTTVAGASFRFNPDLNGKNKRALQAAQAQLQSARLSEQDVLRLVTLQAGRQFVELKRTQARLALLEATLELQSRTLDIVTARFDAGLSPALDVDRAASDLAQSRAQRSLLIASQFRAQNALALLAGTEPTNDPNVKGADQVPMLVVASTGVPADLLRNRPDVRAAEADFIAAVANIGVQKADLYPSLTLPGQIRTTLGNGDVLSNAILSISAAIDIPLLDAGRRRAEVEAQKAFAEAALLSWRQNVLTALTEVENALVTIESITEQLKELETSVERSESAYRQLDSLYREGLTSFIDVLDAQRSLIARRQSVIEARADLAVATIELSAYLAL